MFAVPRGKECLKNGDVSSGSHRLGEMCASQTYSDVSMKITSKGQIITGGLKDL